MARREPVWAKSPDKDANYIARKMRRGDKKFKVINKMHEESRRRKEEEADAEASRAVIDATLEENARRTARQSEYYEKRRKCIDNYKAKALKEVEEQSPNFNQQQCLELLVAEVIFSYAKYDDMDTLATNYEKIAKEILKETFDMMRQIKAIRIEQNKSTTDRLVDRYRENDDEA